jgi:DNA invertase Pin-like site-specific DNA recombinase
MDITEKIIQLRREGKTGTEIFGLTNVSYYHQSKIYEIHNVPTPSRYGQTRQTILAMLAEGSMNQNQIAKTLGVSRQLVSEIKLHEQKKGLDSE